MSLKGRPIGLKAAMTEREMILHLVQTVQDWTNEGFSMNEIDNAIVAKCSPLIHGYYWNRYPDSSERLIRALKKLGFDSCYSARKIVKNLSSPVSLTKDLIGGN